MKYLIVIAAVFLVPYVALQQRITVQDILAGDPIPADHRIAYGDHPMRFGDLRIPEGEGPWPEDMAKRYRFRPKTPVVIELFQNPDHYSVRTVGLPNLGALGVCFGQVRVAG